LKNAVSLFAGARRAKKQASPPLMTSITTSVNQGNRIYAVFFKKKLCILDQVTFAFDV
jgi:hypothetical protein